MGVSRETVIWAYNMILGREPENEAAIETHCKSKDIDALRLTFLKSEEFLVKLPQAREAVAALIADFGHRVPIDAPLCEVDVDVGEEKLAALWQRVRRAWEGMGRERPHHSVLTEDAFMPQELQDNADAFWASGKTECDGILRIFAKHDTRSPSALDCTEYGCGVGRVTVPLAGHFSHCNALDISEPHLNLARERSQEVGRDNITFVNVGDTPDLDIPACDLFYSRIVLQHNPPPIIGAILRCALSALRPDGMAIFQVPVHRKGYTFDIDAYLNQPEHDDMEMHALPQPILFEIVEKAGCKMLEMREDTATDDPNVFVSMTCVVRRPA